MQKDEDVGKIALATPILIYILLTLIIFFYGDSSLFSITYYHWFCTPKCLELFLNNLLDKTTEITRSKNARLISITHLYVIFIICFTFTALQYAHLIFKYFSQLLITNINIFHLPSMISSHALFKEYSIMTMIHFVTFILGNNVLLGSKHLIFWKS